MLIFPLNKVSSFIHKSKILNCVISTHRNLAKGELKKKIAHLASDDLMSEEGKKRKIVKKLQNKMGGSMESLLKTLYKEKIFNPTCDFLKNGWSENLPFLLSEISTIQRES
jgi:uncharacterized protein YjbJ (UPF0337 family)